VAEARVAAAVPRRPAWRDSDPRWRRRVLAGVWLLVLLPLADTTRVFHWASDVRVPAVFEHGATSRPLDGTLGFDPFVYQPLVFCAGVVLLFSNERRRRGRLDRTRRWGVLCCYVVLLLAAAQVLFLCALVLTGIAAALQSLPLDYQPKVIRPFVEVSFAYMRYGPHPSDAAAAALVASSSIAVLLACVPLAEALRACGAKRLAAVLLAPLALFSLIHLAQAGRFALGLSPSAGVFPYALYFRPELLMTPVVQLRARAVPSLLDGVASFVEVVKWCAVLAIAVRLTVAQLATWGKRESASGTSLSSSESASSA
jgi:hypothetical protein